jgi:hypothetical protein
MPSLVVLTRSLRQRGGAKKLGREERRTVRLPPAGDAVAALLDGLAVAQHSQVELRVPAARLLDADEPLRGVATDFLFFDSVDVAAKPKRASKAARRDKAGTEPLLRLVAVPRDDRCVSAAPLR